MPPTASKALAAAAAAVAGVLAAAAADAFNTNPLQAIAEAHTGRVLWKWPHYFGIYHQELAALRARGGRVTMIEVGVNTGGAIDMWKAYFGEDNLVYHGIDLNPATEDHKDEARNIFMHIGSQGDGDFLSSVMGAIGSHVDVIIDDGAHLAPLTTAAFMNLWSALNPDGGLYIVEDLQGQHGTDMKEFFSTAASTVNALDAYNGHPPDEACDLVDSGAGLKITGFCKQAYRVSVYHAITAIEKRAVVIEEPKMYGTADAFVQDPAAYLKANWFRTSQRQASLRRALGGVRHG